jgi:hypothetical protein
VSLELLLTLLSSYGLSVSIELLLTLLSSYGLSVSLELLLTLLSSYGLSVSLERLLALSPGCQRPATMSTYRMDTKHIQQSHYLLIVPIQPAWFLCIVLQSRIRT